MHTKYGQHTDRYINLEQTFIYYAFTMYNVFYLYLIKKFVYMINLMILIFFKEI